MKKRIVRVVHWVFMLWPLEKLLRFFVRGRYVNSILAKLIPTNKSYKKNTQRLVKAGPIKLYGDLSDYNDWKAYWGLKEIERQKLYELAAASKIIVDIGVNNGWVLLNMATIVKDANGFVYGFEPFPSTFQKCKKNIDMSNVANCKVFNIGCGDNKGEVSMIIETETNSGQNRIVDKNIVKDSSKMATITISRLDDELYNVGKIDLIKVDVEGFEYSVLKGAAAILKRDKPKLFIEIDEKLLIENNSSPEELVFFLKSEFGYNIKHAATNSQIDEKTNFAKCHFDIICV